MEPHVIVGVWRTEDGTAAVSAEGVGAIPVLASKRMLWIVALGCDCLVVVACGLDSALLPSVRSSDVVDPIVYEDVGRFGGYAECVAVVYGDGADS